MSQIFADNWLLILASMALGTVMAVAHSRRTRKVAGPPSTLAELEGTYRGFAPTDESPIALGEMKLVMKGGIAKVRMAGGLYIVEEEIPLADFRPMTNDELRQNFNEGYELDGCTIGFRSASREHPQLLFMSHKPGADWKCNELVVRTGGMGEMLSPTVLFSPRFGQRCKFVLSMILMQIASRGRMPWLIFGGKVRRYDSASEDI